MHVMHYVTHFIREHNIQFHYLQVLSIGASKQGPKKRLRKFHQAKHTGT